MNRQPNHNILLIVGKENLAESVNDYPLRPESGARPRTGWKAIGEKQCGYGDNHAANNSNLY